jgi:hypothetical protein
MQVVFRRGCGKGRNPPRSLQDKLERALIKLALQPASPATADAQAAVLGELAHALAAVDRHEAVTKLPAAISVTAPRNVTAPVTPALFFTDARQIEPGYRPREPRSERERLEERLRSVQARRWSDPGDRAEIEAEMAQIEAELRALDQRGGGR